MCGGRRVRGRPRGLRRTRVSSPSARRDIPKNVAASVALAEAQTARSIRPRSRTRVTILQRARRRRKDEGRLGEDEQNEKKRKQGKTRLAPGSRAYLPVRRGEGSDGHLHAPRGEPGGLRAQFLILKRRSENVERVHLRHVDTLGRAARHATLTHAVAVVRLRRERGERKGRDEYGERFGVSDGARVVVGSGRRSGRRGGGGGLGPGQGDYCSIQPTVVLTVWSVEGAWVSSLPSAAAAKSEEGASESNREERGEKRA